MAETTQKPKEKDFAYYACRDEGLAESEKAFVTTLSRNIDEYWSSGDEDEVRSRRNMCLMARESIEPNLCYVAPNNPPDRSIIQHVKSMITYNSFDLSFCEPYLTQIQSEMTVIHRALEPVIEVSEKLDSELTCLRFCFEDRKLKIESLERDLLMSKDECIILKEQCGITFCKRNILVSDDKRLDAKIHALHNSIDILEANEWMTHNFRHPWSIAPSLGKQVSKTCCSSL